jgi:hypothetical protein
MKVVIVVTMKMAFFWDVTLCGKVDYLLLEEFTASLIRMENGGSRFLQNISNDLSDYMVSHPRRKFPHATYFTII